MSTLIKIKDELNMLDEDLVGYCPVIRSGEWIVIPGEFESLVNELQCQDGLLDTFLVEIIEL